MTTETIRYGPTWASSNRAEMEPDLPEWAYEDFGYRRGEIYIGRYESFWFIDEAGDPGLTEDSRRYFIMSAVTHSTEAIDFTRVFDGIPRSINRNGTEEVHFNSLLRDWGYATCMKLTAQIGQQDIINLELIVDKKEYRKSSARPRDLYQASLDVVLECIDGIDVSLRKIIAIDSNSYITADEVDALNRPDRAVFLAFSDEHEGVQIADATSSSMWLEIEPNPGQQRKGLFAPLWRKSVNVNDEEEPRASHWPHSGADTQSQFDYKRTIFDNLRKLSRK